MSKSSYTCSQKKANLPAKIAFVSCPVVGFHTEVITRFAHHPSRKVFQVCSIEHILWARQSLNKGKVFMLSCICRIWFVYFHKFTVLWIRSERGEEAKTNALVLSHVFKLKETLNKIIWICQKKKIDITDTFVLVSLRIPRPWSEQEFSFIKSICCI